MKKFLLFSLLMLSAFIVNAQEQENDQKDYKYVIGGSFSFISGDHITSPTNSFLYLEGRTFFNFNPRFGFHIKGMSSLMLEFNYTTSIPKEESNYSLEYDVYGIGISDRITSYKKGDLKFYVSPLLRYQRIESKQGSSYDFYESYINTLNVGIGFGMIYDLNDQFSATLGLGEVSYRYSKRKIEADYEFGSDTETETKKGFVANFGMDSILFGVEMNF